MAAPTDVLEWYTARTPYDILGVPPDADARHVRDTFNALQRDLQEKGLPAGELAKRTQELEAAYGELRDPANRVRVDFRLLDRNLGRKQCEAIAAGLPKPNTDVSGVVKPRNIKVTHEVLYDQLGGYAAEPPRVTGLFPAPLEFGNPEIPDALDVRFDC